MDGAEVYTSGDQRQAHLALLHRTEHEETEEGEKEEEGYIGRGQPPPTTVANCPTCRAGEGGGGRQHQTCGLSSAVLTARVSGCCCCPQRCCCESQSTNAKTIETSRLGRRRRPAAPEPGSGRGNSNRGLESRRDESPPAAAVAVAAAVEAEGEAEGGVCAAAAAAAGGISFDSKLGPSSRAAVEAWDAAETWALAVAAATGAAPVEATGGAACEERELGAAATSEPAWEAAETWASVVAAATRAVADGESLPSADTAEGVDCKVEVPRVTATGEPDQHLRRNCRVVDTPTQAGRGCPSCCRCFVSGGPAAMVGVCQSAAHRRDSVLCGSSTVGPRGVCQSTVHRRDSVLFSGGGESPLPPFVVDACPRHDAAENPPRRNARSFVVPTVASTTPATGATTAARPAALGAAAAIVLARIDLGEKLWATRARRAGFAALKARRERAGRRKARDTAAARHREASITIRGLRAWMGRTRWEKIRREAAIAASAAAAEAADAFARARRMRSVVAMLKR